MAQPTAEARRKGLVLGLSCLLHYCYRRFIRRFLKKWRWGEFVAKEEKKQFIPISWLLNLKNKNHSSDYSLTIQKVKLHETQLRRILKAIGFFLFFSLVGDHI